MLNIVLEIDKILLFYRENEITIYFHISEIYKYNVHKKVSHKGFRIFVYFILCQIVG